MTSSDRPARHHVTAVLVSHDGGRWLRRTLPALLAQTRLPDRVAAVDTGSADDSVALLTAHLGSSAIVTAPRDTAFGDAVQRGLDSVGPIPAAGAISAPPGDTVEWVWLLHDDSAPAADALDRLLAVVEHSPSAAVIGAKVRDWDDPRRLIAVGVTTDRAGHRHTGIERREVDQGQHDDAGDVLAVGSAGALVRRDVWDALGGYDRALPMFFDDVDFGWRATLAGHRVLVAADAVVHHARAATRGLRPVAATTNHPHRVERRHGLFTVVANSSLPMAVVTVPRLALGTVLRFLGYLLTRRPGLAFDELLAYGWLLVRLPLVVAARRRRRAVVSRRAVVPLLARRGARWRAAIDALGERADRHTSESTTRAPAETGPVEDDVQDFLPARGAAWRRGLRQPDLWLVLALTALALVAERRLISGGHLLYAGGELSVPTGGASDLWHTVTSSWHDVGLGSTDAAPPVVGVLAVLATILFGKPWLAVAVLVLGAIPLTAAVTLLSARRWRLGPVTRCWLAAGYALMPVVTGAVAGGRVGAILALLALPPAVSAGAAAVRDARRGVGWRHWWVAGLWATVAVAADPRLYPALLAVAAAAAATGVAWFLVGAVARRGWRTGPRLVIGSLITCAVPAGALLPWAVSIWHDPAPLVAGYGTATTTASSMTALHTVLLHSPGNGQPPWWFTAPLVAAAVLALLRPDRTLAVVGGWLVAAPAGAVAFVQARTFATPAGGSTAVLGWPGTALALAGAGLLVAAAAGGAGALRALGRSSFGWRQPLALVVAAATLAMPVGLAAATVRRHSPGPLHVTSASTVLPAFVAEDVASSPGARALVLRTDADGSVHYLVTARRRVSFDTATLRPSATEQALLAGVVHRLLAGPDTAGSRLATLGVRYIVLAGDDRGEVSAALDAQPALERSSAQSSVDVWRTTVPSGGLSLLGESLATRATARAAGPATGDAAEVRLLPFSGDHTSVALPGSLADAALVVLPTQRDPRWHATLDGGPLPAVTAWGWAQAFRLPAGASGHGSLAVWHASPIPPWQQWFCVGVLVLALIMAVPTVRGADTDAPERQGHVPDDFVAPRAADAEPAAAGSGS